MSSLSQWSWWWWWWCHDNDDDDHDDDDKDNDVHDDVNKHDDENDDDHYDDDNDDDNDDVMTTMMMIMMTMMMMIYHFFSFTSNGWMYLKHFYHFFSFTSNGWMWVSKTSVFIRSREPCNNSNASWSCNESEISVMLRGGDIHRKDNKINNLLLLQGSTRIVIGWYLINWIMRICRWCHNSNIVFHWRWINPTCFISYVPATCSFTIHPCRRGPFKWSFKKWMNKPSSKGQTQNSLKCAKRQKIWKWACAATVFPRTFSTVRTNSGLTSTALFEGLHRRLLNGWRWRRFVTVEEEKKGYKMNHFVFQNIHKRRNGKIAKLANCLCRALVCAVLKTIHVNVQKRVKKFSPRGTRERLVVEPLSTRVERPGLGLRAFLDTLIGGRVRVVILPKKGERLRLRLSGV